MVVCSSSASNGTSRPFDLDWCRVGSPPNAGDVLMSCVLELLCLDEGGVLNVIGDVVESFVGSFECRIGVDEPNGWTDTFSSL